MDFWETSWQKTIKRRVKRSSAGKKGDEKRCKFESTKDMESNEIGKMRAQIEIFFSYF